MRIEGRYFTYMLQCSDDSYYVGITNDVDRRLIEHTEGNIPSCYTFDRRPVKLVHYEVFRDVKEAIARETQIKGWSRKKKEALMQGDFNALSEHARNSIKKNKDGSGSPEH